MPNKMSVSGSLSHMMKVCENLKFAVQRCKVAVPSEDIDNPSAVLRCTGCRQYFGFIAALKHVIYTCMG